MTYALDKALRVLDEALKDLPEDVQKKLDAVRDEIESALEDADEDGYIRGVEDVPDPRYIVERLEDALKAAWRELAPVQDRFLPWSKGDGLWRIMAEFLNEEAPAVLRAS